MSIHFADAFNQLIREKRIDKEMLMETLTAGFSSAVKKKHGPNSEVLLEDDGHGNLELYLVKNVVEKKNLEDESFEISVQDAQQFAEGAEAGDQIYMFLPFEEFGRNAIQVTKQILMQKLREHDRERVYAEYHDRVGEIVSGSVQQVDRTGILVNLGNAEATMPKREQIRRERYNQGASIRGSIIKVDKEAKGPMVILSRTSHEFLKALFTQEVPEIFEGLIDIKSVAREAGGRSKIAVYSRDDRVDAVGACVGMKGSRVQAVVNELSGERIDIVPWNDDISAFVSRALSPARISTVRANHEEHSVLVVVEEDQLSLAIGKDGQNVRLASKLTGWDIELTSARELEQRERLQEQMKMPIEEMVGVSAKMAERLRGAGITTVQKLVRMSTEDLLAIPGLGPKSVEKLVATAEGTVAELERVMEEMVDKENEEREREKAQEKPLFDDAVLESGAPEEPRLTEESLFRDPDSVKLPDAVEDGATNVSESESDTAGEVAVADGDVAGLAVGEPPHEDAAESDDTTNGVATADAPAEGGDPSTGGETTAPRTVPDDDGLQVENGTPKGESGGSDDEPERIG